MLIGALVERVGTSTRTLRYYEANGLVRARRSASDQAVQLDEMSDFAARFGLAKS